MANVYMGTDVEDFIFGEGTMYDEACSKKEACAKKEACNSKKEACSKKEGCDSGECDPGMDDTDVEEQVTDEELNACGVIECVDDPEVACYRIALENEQNYNMIMNAFMVKEFSVLESTGQEMVYEAVDVKKYFDIVKQAIQRFWAKIKGIFKKLTDNIYARVATNKAFVQKYKGVPMKKPETDKEFKGYNFTDRLDKKFAYNLISTKVDFNIPVSKISSMSEEDAAAEAEKIKNDFEKTKNIMRGIAVAGKDSSPEVTAEDFDKELFKAFFGSEEKVKVDLPEFSMLIGELEKAQGAIKAARSAYKDAESAIKTTMGKIKTAERELSKNEGRRNPGMKIAKCLTDNVNASLPIMSKLLSVHTKAIATKVMQDRAMAAYYITHQPKAQATGESATISENDLGITLI